jgi:hypothetical protein
MKTTPKTTPKKRACKPRAKRVQKQGSPGAHGRLTREEITNLVLQAQEAFHYQTVLGNIEPGTKFDDWRRDHVMDRVGKPGISKLVRADWRNVKALFLELSGRDDEAFALLLKTGAKTDHPAAQADTWESAETYVHQITAALAAHSKATVTHPKGHLHAGWLIAAARQRTGKPTLTMATLAERLDPKTLAGLRDHIISHINLRECRADPDRRTKRTYPKKPDPGDFDSEPF